MKILDLSVSVKMDIFNAEHIHTFSLANKLALLGHKITLIIKGKEIKVIRKHNLEIYISKFDFSKQKEAYFIRIFSSIAKSFRLLLLILRNLDIKSYNVIYERYYPGILHGLILSRLFSKPLFYEVNGIPDEEMFVDLNLDHKFVRSIVTFLCRFQLKRSTGVIVQTPELKNILKRKFGINNVYIVENGVDNKKINSTNTKSNILTLNYTGAFDKSHNPDVVFKSINTIKKKFRFYIIGTGEYLKKYMKKYRNDKRFIFVQEVPHNKALYYILNSDICIGSYDPKYSLFKKYGYYFCSLKLLEYAAASKPSIIYSLSNTFLKKYENANACLVANSRKDFINKLVKLMNNKELREIMGINAKKMAIKYSWENAAKKTEGILKQRNSKM